MAVSEPSGSRQAVEAMLRDGGASMREIATRTGVPYATVRLWNRQARIRTRAGRRDEAPAPMTACGIGGPIPSPLGDAPGLASLGAALRHHIAHQIAAFDARLRQARDGTGAAETDTARVLRDLGGLKRLLNELAAEARKPDGDGDADGESPQDLAALRDRIARRYEAFEAERRHAGVPGAAGAGPAGEAGA